MRNQLETGEDAEAEDNMLDTSRPEVEIQDEDISGEQITLKHIIIMITSYFTTKQQPYHKISSSTSYTS